MHEFKVGDWVYGDDWCHGQIVEIYEGTAYVEYATDRGGGICVFELSELRPAEPPEERVSDDRLTKIIRNAVRAYIFEHKYDFDDDTEIFTDLLNQFEMTESEFNSIMGCTFEQYR